MKKEIIKSPYFWGSLVILVFITYGVFRLHHLEQQFEFNPFKNIHIYTREDGSGTRNAFVEKLNIIDKNGDDAITTSATVQNSANSSVQAIINDPHGINYASLGSINNQVKVLAVDSKMPSKESIETGEYPLYRKFNVLYKNELSPIAKDLWNFMFSQQAQELVGLDGFISISNNAPTYQSKDLAGQISIVGSSSVEQTMTRFASAYRQLNPKVTIDITAPGSGAGINAAIEGTADIAMVSRELSADELSLITEICPIAIDAIVLIVHPKNPLESLSISDIRKIYTDYYEAWDEIL